MVVRLIRQFFFFVFLSSGSSSSSTSRRTGRQRVNETKTELDPAKHAPSLADDNLCNVGGVDSSSDVECPNFAHALAATLRTLRGRLLVSAAYHNILFHGVLTIDTWRKAKERVPERDALADTRCTVCFCSQAAWFCLVICWVYSWD